MAITDKLVDIADAIRTKTGIQSLMQMDDMPTYILSISGGGGGETLPDYTGPTTVTPNFNQQTLLTEGTSVHDDITIEPIQTSEISNSSGGLTLTI